MKVLVPKSWNTCSQFQELVQDLYSFRDRFFETHPIDKASDKRIIVESKMKEVLDKLDELSRKISTHSVKNMEFYSHSKKFRENVILWFSVKQDIDSETNEIKARRTYLKGRALNVVSDHSPEAEQLLSKAVKLEPNLVDAWIELGECYWKRGEVDTAKTCFEGALSHVRLSHTLWSLRKFCTTFFWKISVKTTYLVKSFTVKLISRNDFQVIQKFR